MTMGTSRLTSVWGVHGVKGDFHGVKSDDRCFSQALGTPLGPQRNRPHTQKNCHGCHDDNRFSNVIRFLTPSSSYRDQNRPED